MAACIAASLATRDPDSHRVYRRAAWAYLQNRLRLAQGTEPWRYTADLLFLIQNPVLREGFFPSGPHPLAVEPARPDDEADVHRIIDEKAAPEREALFAWWRYHRDAFRLVRNRDGGACGFSFADGHAEIHRWKSATSIYMKVYFDESLSFTRPFDQLGRADFQWYNDRTGWLLYRGS